MNGAGEHIECTTQGVMDSIYMRCDMLCVRTDLLKQKDVEGARGMRQPQAAPSVVEQESERHVQR